ncbi:MAG: hypothetical protein SFU98_01125 [Leptospiraceae bacterium]|nr:hypothetical protein [Leptospiraceae bacterium]
MKLFLIIIFLFVFSSPNFAETQVKEVKTKYSHIKVLDEGSIRTMYFVRDNGEEVIESSQDKLFPKNLFLLYTQKMFASMLIQPKPEKAILAGLGGGSMVHYINHTYPNLELDVVEIDPEIYKLAKEYFSLKENKRTKIYIEDFFVHIKKNKQKYSIIFMDAFLKPSELTDESGINLKAKDKEFLNDLKNHLAPNGVVAFNINTHSGFKKDIKLIRESFKNIYVFNKTGSGNVIVLATESAERVSYKKMQENAQVLDKSISSNFKYSTLCEYYKETDELFK